MAPTLGKRRSRSSDEEPAHANDKSRTAKRMNTSRTAPHDRNPPSQALENGPKTDSNGDSYWEISHQRRVTISTFKGRTLVNVREYYEKDGQELPGRKGISMTLDQFNKLVTLLPEIAAVVEQKGGSITRPVFSSDTTQEASDSDRPTAGSPQVHTEVQHKSHIENFEATSEEDEG